jgi:hypothetical protein
MTGAAEPVAVAEPPAAAPSVDAVRTAAGGPQPGFTGVLRDAQGNVAGWNAYRPPVTTPAPAAAAAADVAPAAAAVDEPLSGAIPEFESRAPSVDALRADPGVAAGGNVGSLREQLAGSLAQKFNYPPEVAAADQVARTEKLAADAAARNEYNAIRREHAAFKPSGDDVVDTAKVQGWIDRLNQLRQPPPE